MSGQNPTNEEVEKMLQEASDLGEQVILLMKSVIHIDYLYLKVLTCLCLMT
jgi:hypothetical protein